MVAEAQVAAAALAGKLEAVVTVATVVDCRVSGKRHTRSMPP
jgi:hypothetical protein